MSDNVAAVNDDRVALALARIEALTASSDGSLASSSANSAVR